MTHPVDAAHRPLTTVTDDCCTQLLLTTATHSCYRQLLQTAATDSCYKRLLHCMAYVLSGTTCIVSPLNREPLPCDPPGQCSTKATDNCYTQLLQTAATDSCYRQLLQTSAADNCYIVYLNGLPVTWHHLDLSPVNREPLPREPPSQCSTQATDKCYVVRLNGLLVVWHQLKCFSAKL